MNEKMLVDGSVYLALLGAVEEYRRHLQKHADAGTDVVDDALVRVEALLLEARRQLDAIEPPMCRVHDLAMVQVNGKKGEFWSCHQKNSDGSWCSYRPKAA